MLCRCGSKGNSSAVWSYVVVQENIAILTQSTRRYIGSVLEINAKVLILVFSLFSSLSSPVCSTCCMIYCSKRVTFGS